MHTLRDAYLFTPRHVYTPLHPPCPTLINDSVLMRKSPCTPGTQVQRCTHTCTPLHPPNPVLTGDLLLSRKKLPYMPGAHTEMPTYVHAMQETRVQSLGWGDPMEKGMATPVSCLEDSMTTE